MNPIEIQTLMDEYYNWLKDNTSIRTLNDTWIEITTPCLDFHNDYMQIYAKTEGDFIKLSDGGYILSELENYGCDFSTQKRKDVLNFTLNRFGVSLEKGELFVLTTKEDFSVKKQDLVQAMISLGDMIQFSAPAIQSFFFEDVENWLRKNKISFFSDFKLIGKSGFNHAFDFAIPESNGKKEKIIQTLNNPSKNNISQLVFSWLDIKEVRKSDSSLIVIINDVDNKLSNQSRDALANYNASIITWKERNNGLEILAS